MKILRRTVLIIGLMATLISACSSEPDAADDLAAAVEALEEIAAQTEDPDEAAQLRELGAVTAELADMVANSDGETDLIELAELGDLLNRQIEALEAFDEPEVLADLRALAAIISLMTTLPEEVEARDIVDMLRITGDQIDEKLGSGFLTTAPDGDSVAVSVGSLHSCRLSRNGKAACWGVNLDGPTKIPDTEFDSLSAGGEHSCGLTAAGAVQCWGNS